MTQGNSAHQGDVLLLVGTRKGSFVLSSNTYRKSWDVAGPFHSGSDVYHVTYDSRGDGDVLAAVNSMFWGPRIDLGC